MLRKVTGILLTVVGLGLTACTQTGTVSIRGTCGGAEFCLVQCNLGCSLAGGCSVNQIAVNLPLVFQFNKPLDVDSVNTSTLSLRTKNGEEPLGDLVVQGDMVMFFPAIVVRDGQTFFGLEKNAVYYLEIPGGPDALAALKSTTGDTLSSTLKCELTASLGVVDQDGKPPASRLLVPTALVDVEADTLIVLEFSEIINTAAFRDGGTGGGIIYAVSLPDENNQCAAKEFPLPGVVSFNVDRTSNLTTVIFKPQLLLPSKACVKVRVTSNIRDLSGKGAVQAEYAFRVKERPVKVQFVAEDFSTDNKLDDNVSGADWSNNGLRPGKIGGSGILGHFYVEDGVPKGKDVQGRDIYEWNTDKIDIAQVRTLDGFGYTITNGILEFQTFTIPANQHLRFIGTKVPQIRASGRIQIDGAISMPVATAPKRNFDSRRGAFGWNGPCGGGYGGQGGDIPSYFGGKIEGRQGRGVLVPAGHPRVGQAAATGGPGSPAAPASGKDIDVVWIIQSNFKVWCRQISAGGSGACFWDSGNKSCLGKQGSTRKTSNTPIWPYDSLGREFGKPGPQGIAFPILPIVIGRPSVDTFLIAGSGGGGGGTQPIHSNSAIAVWSAGAAGGSGCGSIGFQAGSHFTTGASSLIELKGGAAGNPISASVPGVPSPGGGGSGGSVLIQCGGSAGVNGTVNLTGGSGGTMTDNSLIHVESKGGAGGCGYFRVESDPAPPHTRFSKIQPPAMAGNVGLLRSADYSDVTVGASTWYGTNTLFPPTWTYYVLRCKINGKPVIYSENTALFPGAKLATKGEPVVMWVKSAAVDPKTSIQTGPETDWVLGTIKDLNLPKHSGKSSNGIRFYIQLDKSGVNSIEIESLRFYYVG